MPDLLEQVYAASIPLSTKADIVEHYKAEYPRNWQSKLVHELHPHTDVKNEHNLARRFNPDRISHEPRTEKEREQYKALGKTLPRKAPPGGYHIYGTVWLRFSPDADCEEREIDITIPGDSGVTAQELANMASKEMTNAVVAEYMEDRYHDEAQTTVGDCQPPDLYVEPIE